MMNITTDTIRKKLINELKYREDVANLAITDLLKMPDEYQTQFEKWFESDIVPAEPTLLGLSPIVLVNLCGMKPPAAFLALDWLRRDPEEAIRTLRYDFHLKVPYIPPEKTD